MEVIETLSKVFASYHDDFPFYYAGTKLVASIAHTTGLVEFEIRFLEHEEILIVDFILLKGSQLELHSLIEQIREELDQKSSQDFL